MCARLLYIKRQIKTYTVTQLVLVHPLAHLQMYDPGESKQVPPPRHGLLKHSSVS